MSSKRDKGRVTGEPVPYYAGVPLAEAAKFLQNTCRRYLAERATAREVDEAVELWLLEREKGRGT